MPVHAVRESSRRLFHMGETMDMNHAFAVSVAFAVEEAGTCRQPLTRAPAVRLKPVRRRPPRAGACTCGRAGAFPSRADKRWRLGGAPCLILRRERVPC
jgi:hypothetical protein